MGVPVFVVTTRCQRAGHAMMLPSHSSPRASRECRRQAKAVAGDKIVGVAGPNVAQQRLEVRLLDAISVYLVPVLFRQQPWLARSG